MTWLDEVTAAGWVPPTDGNPLDALCRDTRALMERGKPGAGAMLDEIVARTSRYFLGPTLARIYIGRVALERERQ